MTVNCFRFFVKLNIWHGLKIKRMEYCHFIVKFFNLISLGPPRCFSPSCVTFLFVSWLIFSSVIVHCLVLGARRQHYFHCNLLTQKSRRQTAVVRVCPHTRRLSEAANSGQEYCQQLPTGVYSQSSGASEHFIRDRYYIV